MAIVVVEYCETRLFWKIMMGRIPDCSEPLVGFRSASQISPRFKVRFILDPLGLKDSCIHSFQLLLAHDRLLQIRWQDV